jgi:hypothetical protein
MSNADVAHEGSSEQLVSNLYRPCGKLTEYPMRPRARKPHFDSYRRGDVVSSDLTSHIEDLSPGLRHRLFRCVRYGQRTMKLVLAISLLLASVTLGFVVAHTDSASANTILETGVSPRSVAVVGDSLSWQAKSSIESAFIEAGYVTRVSVNPGHALSSSWVQNTLDADVKDGSYGVIVLETASNDVVQLASGAVPIARYSQLLDRLIAKAGNDYVVIVNAKVNAPFYYKPSDALAINRAIDEAAQKHANVRIVDWNSEARSHASWFSADMLHLSPGLPATVLASDPPSSDEQDYADTAFAQAIVKGVESFAT